ncbi:peptidase C26 [Chromobacterium sp. ATCC 53434]|uniref:gamma-glutamyl-gamma-aminobutyrate hydrolase family protein n=1 Tax=Chromobacterium TaxID=535 RepID=UPI000C78C48B|nr:gamma-glutamyl-gamma-aminobutyrate hydrolase family protein [Chromobacterium sp. ATCC 53434]AUH50874.1 peptidase C26 [Chromobacterium sp. ATCC 53434]
MSQAIIGIPCDMKMLGLLPFHAVGDKYIAAAAGGAGGLPLLIPAMGDADILRATLATLDGLLLPGSPSNVEPYHYGGGSSRQGTLHDPRRDATTLPLIRMVLEAGVPLLGICRGFQEINVALGGELHQHVQEQPGLRDHREIEGDDIGAMYAPAHRVDFVDGGMLARWSGRDGDMVNSLHQQGIKRLAPGLDAEAYAEDGLVEAYRVRDAKRFAFAVQWHPEWCYWDNPVSQAIFQAFGDACRARHAERVG